MQFNLFHLFALDVFKIWLSSCEMCAFVDYFYEMSFVVFSFHSFCRAQKSFADLELSFLCEPSLDLVFIQNL